MENYVRQVLLSTENGQILTCQRKLTQLVVNYAIFVRLDISLIVSFWVTNILHSDKYIYL